MLSPGRLWRRLVAFVRAERLREDLTDEMRFHLEMETARLVGAGLSADAARAEAHRSFGQLPVHRDAAGDARGARALEHFAQDLRFGWRSLLRQRTYAIVAVLTLAVGVGGTTALGSAVYHVLLAPYPFAHADRIVTLWQTDTRVPGSRAGVASANFLDWKAEARSFELMAAAEPYSFDWVGPDGPERFETALVTEDFFPLQGLRPVLGRTFVSEEFTSGNGAPVVISEALWRTRFGGDSAIVGSTLVLDTVPRVVVGVMHKDAMAPFGAEMWAPKIFEPYELTSRTGGYWQVAGRLREGTSLAQAEAELQLIAQRLATAHPTTNRSTGAAVLSLRDAIGGDARRSLLVLLGAVAFVMLIACVNVATLQLGEAVRRQREFAIRTAIGAGRGRLVRQLLTECLLVAGLGAGLGLAFAHVGTTAIRLNAPNELWQLRELSLSGFSLVMAVSLAVVASVSIAVLPISAARRLRLSESLTGNGRGVATTLKGRRANRVLVVAEVALALVLLVGAGLLTRSLAELNRTERGFRTDGVLVTTVQLWSYYPTTADRAAFVPQALDALRAVPGVSTVGVTSALPLDYPIGFERARLAVEGFDVPPGDEQPTERVAAVTPGYFEALGVSVRAGRGLADTDDAGAAPVALVNEAFARRYFGEVSPLGKRVTFGFMGRPIPREIVGIVSDVRHDGLQQDPSPGVFVPHAQAPTGALHFVVRGAGAAEALALPVRRALTSLNGSMPLDASQSMESLVARSLQERRFQLGLLASFSAMGLLLAAIGIYGVMSRATTERTHEIGVRLAVGATPQDVRRMILRSGGALAFLGVGIGVAAALGLTRLMEAMLFGVRPSDPLTYVAAASVLVLAAALASWLPAWRAAAVDPVVALRQD